MSTKNVLTYLGQQEDQKQPSRGVLKKNCSENMQQHPCRSVISIKLLEDAQQIYRSTPMLKFDFNKAAKQLY